MAQPTKFFIENSAAVPLFILTRVHLGELQIRVSDAPLEDAQLVKPGERVGYDIDAKIRSCFTGSSMRVDYKRIWTSTSPPVRMIFNAAQVKGVGPVFRLAPSPN